jgi:hypothetical protein
MDTEDDNHIFFAPAHILEVCLEGLVCVSKRKSCRPQVVSGGAVTFCVCLSRSPQTKLNYKLSNTLFKVLSQLANSMPERGQGEDDESDGEVEQTSSAVQSNSILLVMMQLSEAVDSMASDGDHDQTQGSHHSKLDAANGSSIIARGIVLRHRYKLDGTKVPKISIACSDCTWQKWHPAEDNGEILAEPCLPSPHIVHEVFASDVLGSRTKNEAEIAIVMSEDCELKEYCGVQKKAAPNQALMNQLISSSMTKPRKISSLAQMQDGAGSGSGLRMLDTAAAGGAPAPDDKQLSPQAHALLGGMKKTASSSNVKKGLFVEKASMASLKRQMRYCVGFLRSKSLINMFIVHLTFSVFLFKLADFGWSKSRHAIHAESAIAYKRLVPLNTPRNFY